VLVLPAPLGPSTAVTSPEAAENVTPRTASRSPYRTLSPVTSMAATPWTLPVPLMVAPPPRGIVGPCERDGSSLTG